MRSDDAGAGLGATEAGRENDQVPPADDPRTIPDPGFAGDDGAAPAELTAALAAWDADPGAYPELLGVLQRVRLLVPVVAVLGEVEYDEAGLAHDKTSDMAAVLMRGGDGRLALLAFTSTAALTAWDPAARPVPVTAPLAAQSAIQDGAQALLVDVAGPVTLVVEGDDLQGLARGWTLARVGSGTAWIRPDAESSVSIQR